MKHRATSRQQTGSNVWFPLFFRHFDHCARSAGSTPSKAKIRQNEKQSKLAEPGDSAAYPSRKRQEPIGSIVADFAMHNLPFG
ncbi:hypothetical protein [Peteryoungia algae]|uniref:Uncharacterized protein n=1 Tax=Peteryoungia algae TaxID=2919917 RepID=A0ABT0D1A2_9HYPH|nr:hypothetical protein [Rhizobium sp. SSM4.3]MCJ8239203.1 hypothetical protein [Rhizobium sp. SSM4.3]